MKSRLSSEKMLILLILGLYHRRKNLSQKIIFHELIISREVAEPLLWFVMTDFHVRVTKILFVLISGYF
jgi:hypothetical protein